MARILFDSGSYRLTCPQGAVDFSVSNWRRVRSKTRKEKNLSRLSEC